MNITAWQRAKAALDTYPEARRYQAAQKLWAAQQRRIDDLEKRLAAARQVEQQLREDMEQAALAMPEEARQALL